MNKNTLNVVVTVSLLVIANLIIYSIHKTFDSVLIFSALFPNVAIIYAYLLKSKMKGDKLNKILTYILFYLYFLIATVISCILLVIKTQVTTVLIVHGVLFVLAFAIYFYILTVSKQNKTLQAIDKKTNINYKAFEIDINSIKGKRGDVIDTKIERLTEIIKYSPKNSNAATADLDAKIKAAIDVLLEETLSDEEFVETLDYIEKFVKEKNNILELTN